MTAIKSLLFLLARVFFFKRTISNLKNKGVLIYLRALQVARKSLIGAVLVFSALQLMILGVMGSIAAGIFLLPQDFETKLWILFFTCLGLFLIPLFVLGYALSERVWYEASGAEKIINRT